jgi:hypothetical protein
MVIGSFFFIKHFENQIMFCIFNIGDGHNFQFITILPFDFNY